MKTARLIVAMMAFGVAAIFFIGTVWATVAPREFDRRVEWVELKVQALLPHAPQPEFVPTPLPQAVVSKPTSTRADFLNTRVLSPAPMASPTRGVTKSAPTATRTPTRGATKTPNPLPTRVLLAGFKHDYQRWNNCGPATLAILLSHFGRSETQYDLAPILKGNKDDKNVSPDELAAYARSIGLRAVVRVNGDAARMKRFLARGIPVMVENWFIPRQKDASGHYRLLVGYDDAGTASTRGVGLSVEFDENYPATEQGFFIAQDSYNGANVKIPYRAWDLDWRVFNRTYVVIYTDAQAATVDAIIGDDADDATMYTRAREVAEKEIAANENDAFGWFNLGSSLVGLSEYEDAARAYDRARVLKLPWRMMWYQFGPYEAYYHAGRYDEVIALANATLANTNGVEESYYYRGLAQLALGQKGAARESFQHALEWNAHFVRAKEEMEEIGD